MDARARSSAGEHRSITSSLMMGVGGLIVIAVIGAVATHALVVHFGPDDYGILTLALSAAATIQGLTEFGQTQLLQREIARAPLDESELLSDSLSLRVTSTLVVSIVAGMVLIAIYARHSQTTAVALILALAAVPLASASQALGAHFYHRLRNARLVYSQIAQQVLYFGFVIIVVSLGLSVSWATATTLAATIPVFIVLVVMVHRVAPLRYSIHVDRWKKTLVAAAPLGASSLLGAVYLKADVLILGVEGTHRQIGQYGVAIAINSFFFTLPTQLTRVFMPVISRAGEKWLPAGQDLIHWAWIVGLASFTSLLAGAPYVVHVFAGAQYHDAVTPLRILGGSIPAIAVGSALTALCVARGYAKMLGVISASMLVINVISNIIVIPHYGIVGSAWATTVCEYVGVVLVAIHFARRSGTATSRLHRPLGLVAALGTSLLLVYLTWRWTATTVHFAMGQVMVLGSLVSVLGLTGYLPRTLMTWLLGGRHHKEAWWHRILDPRGFHRREHRQRGA